MRRPTLSTRPGTGTVKLKSDRVIRASDQTLKPFFLAALNLHDRISIEGRLREFQQPLLPN